MANENVEGKLIPRIQKLHFTSFMRSEPVDDVLPPQILSKSGPSSWACRAELQQHTAALLIPLAFLGQKRGPGSVLKYLADTFIGLC